MKVRFVVLLSIILIFLPPFLSKAGFSYPIAMIPAIIGGVLILFVIPLVGVKKSVVQPQPAHPTARPVVCAWERNGVVRVMPNIDWELWHQRHDREVLAGAQNPWKSRPDSHINILFSDKTDGVFTGTMAQFKKLVQGCRVERSEMNVLYGGCVKFSIAWKLVHGADSKPPEE